MGKTNDLTKWYDRIPSNLLKKYHNPSYDNHLINIPHRILLAGGSGSGKTTLVLELIKRMAKTFQLIVLCCKNSSEPLYEYLKSKLKPDELVVYENGVIPPPSEFDGMDEQVLMIFDDLVNMKNQAPIIEYFIRGRKLAGGISLIYLTQSYFLTPKTIRVNCDYVILKKLNSTKDLTYILREYNLGVDKKTLLKLYSEATRESSDFLLIDLQGPPTERFRHNFLDIFELPDTF
jgi:DNA polymerase III delta prime subunit